MKNKLLTTVLVLVSIIAINNTATSQITDLGKVCAKEVFDYLDANKIHVGEKIIWQGKYNDDQITMSPWSDGDNTTLKKNGSDVGDACSINEDDNLEIEGISIGKEVGSSDGSGTCLDQDPLFVEVIAAIPLKVIKFDVTYHKKDKSILIKMRYANRLNVDYLNLEASRNGVNFESIEISHFDNPDNLDEESFEFIVKVRKLKSIVGEPFDENQYYFRIGIVDLEGSVDFTRVISVLISESQTTTLAIYPNPVKQYINIVTNKESKLYIYNNLGKCIKQVEIEKTKIDLSNLQSGLYFYRTDKGDIGKFVKE